LRERPRKGDPDLAADELQAAIERAEQKRRELESTQPVAKFAAEILLLLPRAAELYRRQIAKGLDGNPREALKSRVILREMFSGKIRLVPGEDGSLWAEYAYQPAALLKGVGTGGSGGVSWISHVPEFVDIELRQIPVDKRRTPFDRI